MTDGSKAVVPVWTLATGDVRVPALTGGEPMTADRLAELRGALAVLAPTSSPPRTCRSRGSSDDGLARWAAQLAPMVAIEAIIAWLDAGQPDPSRAAARMRQAIMGVLGAAVGDGVDGSFPQPAPVDGAPS